MRLIQQYLGELAAALAAGAAKEQSLYPALQGLLTNLGDSMQPKVVCIMHPADRGAGHPDCGLYTHHQVRAANLTQPLPTGLPERGVIEAKPPHRSVWDAAQSDQVARYWERYGLVLVTNFHTFLVVGRGPFGRRINLEHFELAADEPGLRALCRNPRGLAPGLASRFHEFLLRLLQHNLILTRPADVAWFLASYARDARDRIEAAHATLPTYYGGRLDHVRVGLESALGIRFDGEKGRHFFQSTLVQTLFYGLFSAWVIWCRQSDSDERRRSFSAQAAAWHLKLPVLRGLFEEIYQPGSMGISGLREVMDWAGDRMSRVDYTAFFAQFREDQAVQYFYEPFLEAFDPELRKQLGVWYTPPEVVDYMVARVDQVLREQMGIEDGLADPRVQILDPCCGTGSYLVAILKRIERQLTEQGKGALVGPLVKQAAIERIHGFEILPAPYVIAHLQIGMVLEALGAPLRDEGSHTRDTAEWPSIKMTNALIDWFEKNTPEQPSFHCIVDLENDKYYAAKIKQGREVLVIIGNPPYNSYAGISENAEERALTEAYRVPRDPALRKPEGHGLNDLYVRFWRMAERLITELTGRGVVSFITNYSWLDGLSHSAMRERFLTEFDQIWIDCLNGDKYKTGKLTPDRKPDPSVFSTERNREGIQVGTAIGLMVRRHDRPADPAPAEVKFRHFWGTSKRADLSRAADGNDPTPYQPVKPPFELGLPMVPGSRSEGYLDWPRLPDLMPTSFPGIKTSRDEFLVDIDRDQLEARLVRYFDPSISHSQIARELPSAMEKRSGFDPIAVRQTLIASGGIATGSIVRYLYRPFDLRWLFWVGTTNLLDRRRADYFASLPAGGWYLAAVQQNRKQFDRPLATRLLSSLHIIERGANFFPERLALPEDLLHPERNSSSETNSAYGFNASYLVREWLSSLVADLDSLMFHVVAITHATAYGLENASVLSQDWPRIPLPGSAAVLAASAGLGRQVAELLDPELALAGITRGTLRRELRPLGIMRSRGPAAHDLAITQGWGRPGQNGVCMPGRGDARARDWSAEELADLAAGARTLGQDLEALLACLGDQAFDLYLNDDVWWSGVPARVWTYRIGGYQVLKKWLSYREHALLGRPLTTAEADYLSQTIRRLAALLLLEPALDANYRAVRAQLWPWPRG